MVKDNNMKKPKGALDRILSRTGHASQQGAVVAQAPAGKAKSLAELKKTWAPGVVYDIPLAWVNMDDVRLQTRPVTDEAIKDMASSISKDKQIQASELWIDPKQEKLVIALGWTRSLACFKVLKTTVKATITSDDFQKVKDRAWDENLRRTDIPEVHLVRGMKSFLESGRSADELCERFGFSKSHFYAFVKVADYPILMDALEKEEITFTAAIKLAPMIAGLRKEEVDRVMAALRDSVIGVNGIKDFLANGLHQAPSPAGAKGSGSKEPGEKTPGVLKEPKEKERLFYTPGKGFAFVAKGHAEKSQKDELEAIRGDAARFIEILDDLIKRRNEGL